MLKRAICDVAVWIFLAERRIDQYIRRPIDALLRPPLAALIERLLRRGMQPSGLAIAEERISPGEDAARDRIIELFAGFLGRTYNPGEAVRAGNTKTYGVVRADFSVVADLPEQLRRGVFIPGRTYPAWVRFGGPGPLSPPDLDDNGVLSIGIKLMGVDGPKLFDDERQTQDFTAITVPVFQTPDVFDNVKLHTEVMNGTAAWYYINPFGGHLLDGLMQALYNRVHSSPLEAEYWSCSPFLCGEGQAMKFALRPASRHRTRIPFRPGPDYLRDAMRGTLSKRSSAFDFLVQLQEDPDRDPIENASVPWHSPFVRVARLTIRKQEFDSPEQLRFANNLSFNPWHSRPEHRPLGSLNRARKVMYQQLSLIRQGMNGDERIEPSGSEVFPGSAPA